MKRNVTISSSSKAKSNVWFKTTCGVLKK